MTRVIRQPKGLAAVEANRLEDLRAGSLAEAQLVCLALGQPQGFAQVVLDALRLVRLPRVEVRGAVDQVALGVRGDDRHRALQPEPPRDGSRVVVDDRKGDVLRLGESADRGT